MLDNRSQIRQEMNYNHHLQAQIFASQTRGGAG